MEHEDVAGDESRGGEMDDTAFTSAVGAAVGDAIDYMDTDVAPFMESATAYYRGDLFGDEEEGRSQVVMTEVRDVVQAMLPGLLRIFAGSERVVEFIPRDESKVSGAEQATDYVNYLLMVENHGFRLLLNGFKDALVRKIGVLHWWAEDREQVEEISFSDLTQEEIDLLTSDEDVTLIEQDEQDDVTPAPHEGDPDALPSEPLFTARVRRRSKTTLVKAATLPPEELFVSRDAHTEDDALAIGRRRDMRVSELVSMGFDLDEITANMEPGRGTDMNGLADERNPSRNAWGGDKTGDPATQTVTYFDAYVLVDRDGDGIAERRRVRGINPKNPFILSIDGKLCDELWADDVPFGLLCPDPEPHTVVGYSIADQVADLQEIKSAVVRNTLDSLANSIHPRTVIVEGQVNVDDALNTEVGAVIRARQPGMVQPLAMPFVGQYSLPLIGYLDQVRSQRTGISEASQGLDADVLQSTTKAAVTATVSAAQERVEMIARIFAETGLRRLMRGLLKLSVQHSDKERVFRLRNKWIPVDPRSWDADMDVIVNIGLGRGTDADRLQLYSNIASRQEAIIMQAGPGNPLAGLTELRNTYAKIMELGGERDVSKFFKQIDEQALAQAASQQQQPPNPALILAQIEQSKAQVQAMKAQADAQLAAQKHVDEMALRREQLAQERELKMAEIAARYQVDVNRDAINAQVQRERDGGKIALEAAKHEATISHQTERAQGDLFLRAHEGEAGRAHQADQADADRAHRTYEAASDREHAGQQADADRQQAAKQPTKPRSNA
jgi:hypothetical protein